MTDTTATRRQLIADAAITTLARAGMRGLTHRAVDQTAGLPEGSCSYYFRTRQALLQATLERLIEVDSADLPPGTALVEGGVAEVARAAAGVVRYWTSAAAGERMVARYELMLEASRRPELHEVLGRAREHYHRMAEVTLTAAGTSDPAGQAQLFIACLDGLVFRHLTGADPIGDGVAELMLDLLTGMRRRRE
ncbi:TetR/AcrR family transcriptional regulator [Paractinoplanes rishiriensis]|uniref:TetR/AcrR family transcriptional regulator n=1 Tax=Paractinoplanes rishiriensis TaxID=1050105 RepID=UPI0019403A31|nr:TetR family transcriptional regulator [Actinoplanes rishiriensis]